MLLLLWAILVFAAMVVVAHGQPLPPSPPNYQELLERALTREASTVNICAQRQEDLVKYFQSLLRTVTEERDALRKQVPLPAGVPAERQ